MDQYISPRRLEEGEKLGEGGFGVVLGGRLRNAEGEVFEVAIKQLSLKPKNSPQASQSGKPNAELEEAFVREINSTITASKKCPHVVDCFGWSSMKNGSLCLLMRKYKCSLHAFIYEQIDEPLPLLQVVKMGLDIARGLHELHQLGIIFEDLKPGNVLLDEEGNAALADFGLSKPLGTASHHSTYTTAGTYFFMPPEKMVPEKKKVGFYSDMWSYGITLLQLLKSDIYAPYGPAVELPNIIVKLIVQGQPPAVPAILECPALQALLTSCLNLEGPARPSAAETVKILEGILSSPPLSPRSSALRAKEKELEALREKLAEAELKGAEEQKRRAEAERKHVEAEQRRLEAEQKRKELEQREAQLRVLSRPTSAKLLADQRAASPLISPRQRVSPPLSSPQQRAASPLSSPQQRASLPLSSPQQSSSRACTATLKGHSGGVRSVAFTPDGNTLVSGSQDGTLKLWIPASGDCKATLTGHDAIGHVAMSKDGRRAVSCTPDKSPLSSPLSSTLLGGKEDAYHAKTKNRTAKVWSLRSQSCKATLSSRDLCQGKYTCWTSWLGVAFSQDDAFFGQDDAFLVTQSDPEHEGGLIRLLHVGKRNEVATLEGDFSMRSVTSNCALSPDGRQLAMGTSCLRRRIRDEMICLWKVKDSTLTVELKCPGHYVESIMFSHDGKFLLSGSSEKSIRVWDIATCICTRTLIGHSRSVLSLALSPDGSLAVSGSSDNTIKVWDWQKSGACLATLEGHRDGVCSVAVSPDGQMLASGSGDKTIKLWRVPG